MRNGTLQKINQTQKKAMIEELRKIYNLITLLILIIYIIRQNRLYVTHCYKRQRRTSHVDKKVSPSRNWQLQYTNLAIRPKIHEAKIYRIKE
jgi:hypothetical protein